VSAALNEAGMLAEDSGGDVCVQVVVRGARRTRYHMAVQATNRQVTRGEKEQPVNAGVTRRMCLRRCVGVVYGAGRENGSSQFCSATAVFVINTRDGEGENASSCVALYAREFASTTWSHTRYVPIE